MNIVLTCGHPYSGIQSVHALLVEAGLSEPGVSRREGMGVPEFHQRVLTAHGVDLTIPTSLAPVTPGRVWEGLAVDLILGNLDAPNWGWADPGAVWLLDFWSQIDPQIRFVLVYATPERVVAEMLRQGALSPDGIAQAMMSWVAYHAELLRFFHRHRDRCILVDFTAATSMPRRLVTKVVDGLGLCLDPSRVVPDADSAPQSVLEALLVGGLIPHDTEAGAIYAELEGTADLSNDSDALPPNLLHAWGEYGHLLARLDQSAKEAQRLRETTARLEQEGENAKRELAQATDELASQQAAFAQQRDRLDLTLAAQQTTQQELASAVDGLRACRADTETCTKQLAARQVELDTQSALRKETELRLKDASRRADETADALEAAAVAQRITEAKRAESEAQAAAATAENELLLLQLHQVQEELEQYYLRSQTLEEAEKQRQTLEETLATERTKQSGLAEEIQRLQARVAQGEAAAKQLSDKQKELNGQITARKQAEQSLAEAAQRAEDLSRQLLAEKSAHRTTEEALKHDAPEVTALAQENELLLLQLHQVQEELERYYLQCQEPSWSGAPTSFGSGVTLKQLTQATVDLRGEINGNNWYDAEQDGRWAGPGQVSTLVLPALAVGRYHLALEVVDAIAPDVLNGMTLSLNGKPLAIKRSHRGSLTLVTAQFSSETSAPGEQWKLELSFPRLMSPAEKGSDDHRTLAVRVRTLSIVPVGADSDWPGAEASASGKLGSMRPTQITFDLRGDIDGDNWYDAEHDGRWAGPDQVSSLILPALGVGRYQMELEVVDAMAPEIVNGMTLSLNGRPLTVNPNCRGYPSLVTAEFSTDAPSPDGQWELGITFPRLVSPADQGSDDRRTLAIRLRTISLQEILPDARKATVPRSRKKASGARGDRKSYRWWGSKK